VAALDRILGSTDGGNTWQVIVPPDVRLPPITSVALDRTRDCFFLGTQGAGVWRVDSSD
jgi:hypothetical protein